MKKTNVLILVFIFLFILCDLKLGSEPTYPTMLLDFDKNVRAILTDVNQREEIYKYINESYREMWIDFTTDNNGKKKLPYCVYDAIESIRINEQFIKMTFSIGQQTSFPDFGDVWEGRPAKYAGLPDDNLSGQGIWIFGVWRKLIKTSNKDGSKEYCLKGLIFHEMCHYAIDRAIKTIHALKEEFSVNFYQEPGQKIEVIENGKKREKEAKTTIDNLYSDEGVIEDCELKLFPCGPDGYKFYAENQFYSNGARRFNPNQQDCELCKICKQK